MSLLSPSPGPGLPPFEFATATRIVFGAGTLRQLGALTQGLGRRALVVTGAHPARAQPAVEALSATGWDVGLLAIPGEPTTTQIADGVAQARADRRELIVGFGGGSAVDAAKAIAGLLPHDGDLLEYLEVIGQGRPLTRPAVPWIAVPTTAGAGAEVTRNAVLTSREHGIKASLRSPLLLARIALVDPELTLDLPPAVTAATGLDALTQLIEPFVCRRTNPLVDALCRDGIRRIATALRRAHAHGQDLAAREHMALAALFGGLALANAGLGAVHGLAAPLGGSHPAPHGAVCAALLPHVLETNLRALQERSPGSPLLARFDEIARCLTGEPDALAADGLRWIHRLTADLGIPSLRVHGLLPGDFDGLATRAAAASSMKANPVTLTHAEIVGILRAAW